MGRHRSRSLSSSSSGRGIQSSSWDGKSGYRVHVSDIAAGVSKKEIERVFRKFGTINEVWVATNPPCFAFVNFKHRSDAKRAIIEVDGKTVGSSRVGVSWARTRTFGGRNRGSREGPYGSYRSDSRRHSRSRSRSGSRQRRRHRSRSRSDSRSRRRRSPSPRNNKRSPRNEDENRKDGRKRSRTSKSESGSASRSRSRSKSKNRSVERQDSPKTKRDRSSSHDSIGPRQHQNENDDSAKESTQLENNNIDGRSPSVGGGDSNQ